MYAGYSLEWVIRKVESAYGRSVSASAVLEWINRTWYDLMHLLLRTLTAAVTMARYDSIICNSWLFQNYEVSRLRSEEDQLHPESVFFN